MNLHNFYTKIYGFLINRGMPFWLLSPIRRIVRISANQRLKWYFKNNIFDKSKSRREEDLIVSFTSFPNRIETVWMVVQSIKRQTLLPAKIILWLSIDQFPGKKLPDNLLQEIDDIFEVQFVEGDIRSHKKYFYVSQKYPEKHIFLIDDDILYCPDLLERVWNAHNKYPNAIISNYGFLIHYKPNCITPDVYNTWKENFEESDNPDLFFGSGGGTLFNPKRLYQDLTDIGLATKLTPYADDIWLNSMMRLAGISCHMIKHGLYLRVEIKENIKLASRNVGDNLNDKQLNDLRNYYIKTIGKDPFQKMD